MGLRISSLPRRVQIENRRRGKFLKFRTLLVWKKLKKVAETWVRPRRLRGSWERLRISFVSFAGRKIDWSVTGVVQRQFKVHLQFQGDSHRWRYNYRVKLIPFELLFHRNWLEPRRMCHLGGGRRKPPGRYVLVLLILKKNRGFLMKPSDVFVLWLTIFFHFFSLKWSSFYSIRVCFSSFAKSTLCHVI